MEIVLNNVSDFSYEDEKLLLHKLQAGDHDAFTYIYNQYADSLFAYGTRLGFDKNILEDAIQDVYCYLYTHRSTLTRVNNLHFYLLKSLKNRLLLLKDSLPSTTVLDNQCLSFKTEVTILDCLIEEEDRRAVKHKIEEYLNRLTNRQREAIFLRYIEDLDYEEISEILKMSVPSVRNLVLRGMNKIRSYYINIIPFVFLFLF